MSALPDEKGWAGAMALALHQPWAWALCEGRKLSETRGRRTPFRGWLLVHATKQVPDPAVLQRLRGAGELAGAPEAWAHGAVVGLVRLADAREMTEEWLAALAADPLAARELQWGGWQPGRWAWTVSARLLLPEPVPCRGHQWLWRPGPEVLRAARAQVDKIREEGQA